jgi:hypothetical protein
MVLVALWPARSPRLSAPRNNLPGVKLCLPCSRPLVTHYCLLGGTCSLFESPLLADPAPTPTKHCFVVAPSSMTATMTTMPRSGNNATLLGNDTPPLGARSATTTPRSGDDTNHRGDATPLGARSVTMMPSSESIGNNIKLGNDSMLVTTMPRLAMMSRLLVTTPSLSHKPYGATLGDNATLGDDNAKLGNDATLLLTMMAMTTTTTSEGEPKTLIMGHEILSFHAPVVSSFLYCSRLG